MKPGYRSAEEDGALLDFLFFLVWDVLRIFLWDSLFILLWDLLPIFPWSLLPVLLWDFLPIFLWNFLPGLLWDFLPILLWDLLPIFLWNLPLPSSCGTPNPAIMDNVSQAPVTFFKNSTIPLFKLVQAINLYLIPVICGVGLAGGAGSFAVLTFTTFRYQPCSHYLAVLTVSDTGFLVALLIAWLTTLHPNLTAAPGYCQ
ncbi:hypothetical protein BaRGS_00012130, partial [Batillaria attramentaria]